MFLKRIVLLVLLCAPGSAFAWGTIGHRAVARIAENHLSAKARREIAQLLGSETLPLVSTWPDEVRSDPQYKETGPWHYLNVVAGLDLAAFTAQLTATTAPAPTDAYSALQLMRSTLKDRSKTATERLQALKFVVHLVGDVHQPLHVGRAEDRGGNGIAVSWRGRDTNLHSIWDGDLVEYPGFTYSEMAAAYDRATRAQIRQWQKDDVATWLFESYQLCTPAYAAAAASPKFDYRFYSTFAPAVEQQILKAGIRLAGVLNEAFAN